MAVGKFTKWVRKLGGADAVGRKLGVTGAAVRYWLRGEYAPSIPIMQKIIKLSKGQLNFNDIITESRRNFGA